MKAAGDDDDAHEHEAQVQIVGGRILERKIVDLKNAIGAACLKASQQKMCASREQFDRADERTNRICNIAERRANPKEHREATEQIFAEFDPFGCCARRRQRVWAVALEDGVCLLRAEALKRVRVDEFSRRSIRVGEQKKTNLADARFEASDELVKWNFVFVHLQTAFFC